MWTEGRGGGGQGHTIVPPGGEGGKEAHSRCVDRGGRGGRQGHIIVLGCNFASLHHTYLCRPSTIATTTRAEG